MNNSFSRLIDGMCATLRQEVLSRLDDDFARGQVFGVINLLNTFKVRADWSAGFLLQQLAVQSQALEQARQIVPEAMQPQPPLPVVTPVAELLARRDAANRAIMDLLHWLDTQATQVEPGQAHAVEELMRAAMLAETEIELKHSPRPLFAEMSSGREG